MEPTTRLELKSCNHFPDVNSPCATPFKRIIEFGYYDGITGGVTICEMCNTTLLFRVFTEDIRRDNRIFSFSPLAQGSFDAILKAYSPLLKPTWPIWLPKWDRTLMTEFDKAHDTITEIEKTVSRPEQVAYFTYDFMTVVSHRKFPEQPFESFEEWLKYLDLKSTPNEDFDIVERK